MPKKEPTPLRKRRRSRSKTPEEREMEIANKAYDLVEQRIEDGTASAMEVVYFLKMASSREHDERELLRSKTSYERTKTRNLEALQDSGESYRNAIRAFSIYNGRDPDEEDDYE